MGASDISADAARPRPPIVAIGASAGGLDALERMFDGLSCESGATYVVIQHLSPDHKSMMATLLARHTRMPVVMVEQDMAIQPDHVYLIPPGSIMHMGPGQLQLTPKSPGTLSLPIDVFFQSLAAQDGARAIAVVLSGTGSDGTRGAVAINAAGGLLIAQEPQSAKFDGMPRSVIATGLVDAILPVEQIGSRILAHLQHRPEPCVAPGEPEPERPVAPSAESALDGIMHLLLLTGGIDFQEYKPGTVMRRIERRMGVRKVASLGAYFELLNQDRNEVLTLRRELLIPVTSFFRDAEAFDILARQVIEPLVARKLPGESIRVWAAGVATGEEAYSLAMLFLEAFDQAKRWPALKVFATDVEQQNIETGGAGMYPESVAAEVSPAQLERFFTRKGAGYLVKNDLRQCIVFARHNLLADPPFTKMDLVVCRNTLIYFGSVPQERALRRLQYALAPRGCLFLGSSESLGELQPEFTPISARHKIWQLTTALRTPLDAARSMAYGSQALRSDALAARPLRSKGNPVEQGFATLLKAFAPPAAVLVNARHELVHSYGEVQRFLQLREGQASLDLSRILPEPLVAVAAALLFKANREGTSVSSDRLHIDASSGEREHLRLSAWPVGDLEGERLSLLAFEAINAPAQGEAVTTVDVGEESVERIQVLERELAATRESLQATIEELETSNEELQATNEELMSSNEELQSSNEELQSVNEELNTVNAEYQEKIDILRHLHADLDHMAQAVAVGTVFVDANLLLMRFSPDARLIFKVRDSDVGRPLDDLAHTLDYPALIGDLRATMRNGARIEKEVRGHGGQHYLVRMLPYRVPSSSTLGAVASFLDVSALHEVSRLQEIIDAMAASIAVLDTGGTITMVNRAWCEFAAANGDAQMARCGPGTNYLEICDPALPPIDGSAHRAAQGLRDVLEGRVAHFSIEYPCHSATERRWFLMHVSAVGGDHPGAVVSHVDITRWWPGRDPVVS